eukprot:TRINITY_DN27_c0_g1_i7.p1 TRINITY_DN27_c0_g1~~TRINITY_DN27_c0_g1_i7.p1  ORF type:complete len:1597 (+),score=259.00 TRINITY_DN27_c0_g1_i7:2453-7243(+)
MWMSVDKTGITQGEHYVVAAIDAEVSHNLRASFRVTGGYSDVASCRRLGAETTPAAIETLLLIVPEPTGRLVGTSMFRSSTYAKVGRIARPHHCRDIPCFFAISHRTGTRRFFKEHLGRILIRSQETRRNLRKLCLKLSREVTEALRLMLLRCGDVHPNPGPGKPRQLLTWKTGPPGEKLRQRAQGAQGTKGPPPPPPPSIKQVHNPRMRNPLRGAEQVTLSTINLTSAANQAAMCVDLGSDIIAIQETALTLAGQEQMRAVFEGHGYRPLWGPPQPGRQIKGLESPLIAVRGGVAVLVKKAIPAYTDNSLFDKIGQKNRVTHVKVALDGGGSWLHKISLYAKDGTKTASKAAREELLGSVLNTARARLGDVPVVVAGDFNTQVQKSPVLMQALREHWVDAMGAQAMIDRTDPPPSYKTKGTKGTRIDYVLMNPIAATTFMSCTTSEYKFPGGHRPITATLSLPAFKQNVERFVVPKELPKPSATHNTLPTECSAFREAVANKDVEATWALLSKHMEEYLLDACEITQEDRHRYSGRGSANAKTYLLQAKTTKLSEGAATKRQVELHKAANQLGQIADDLERRPAGPGQMAHEMKQRLAAVNKQLRKLDLTRLADDMQPDLLLKAVVERHAQVSTLAKEATKTVRMEREATALAEIKNSFGKVRRSVTAFIWHGTSDKKAACAVKRDDGTSTANVNEMDDMLYRAWDPVFRKYKNKRQPRYAPFKRRYAKHIRRTVMTCPLLSGDMLREVLDRKSSRGACGVDGWRNSELKNLPQQCLEDLATFLNLVEETGTWPVALTKALVTPIPKDESREPLKHRPITVTSCVYRLWACARLREILKWQETWIHNSQEGFRPKHRADDVLFKIALQLEDALLGGDPLHGVALDFAKCFDSVPQQLTLELVADMGLDPKILGPLRAMYDKLERRFKLPLGVGKPFEVTNGILQGCPISVILVNALLSTVVKCIEDEVPGAFSSSYADDMYLLSRLDAVHLQAGLNRVEEFCRLTGMELNHSKSHVFSSAQAIDDILLDSRPLGKSSRVKALGSYLITRMTRRTDSERIDAAIEAARRLGATKLSFDQKRAIIEESIIPAALYGALFTPPPASKVDDLLAAIAASLTGPHFTTRAPGAVTTILLKAHLCDPLASLGWRMLNSAHAQTHRMHGAPQVVKSLLVKYDAGKQPAGPIGNLYERVLKPMKAAWDPVAEELTYREPWAASSDEEDEERPWVKRLIGKGKGEVSHIFRDMCRFERWKELEERSTFAGLAKGVYKESAVALHKELVKTNTQAAAQLVRVLTGGLFYSHPNSTKSGDSNLQRCAHCPYTVESDTSEEMTTHVYYECPAHDKVRGQKKFAGIMKRWRELDKCFTHHGILTEEYEENLGQTIRMQSFLLNIVRDRDRLYQSGKAEDAKTAPWHRCRTGKPHKVPTVSELLAAGWKPKKEQKARYGLVTTWLDKLLWYEGEGSVSCVELAVDMEATCGKPLVGRTTPWKERAGAIRTLLRSYTRTCEKHGFGNPLPCKPVKIVHSLRTVGGPTVIGYDRRPIFHAKTITHPVLDTLLPKEDPRKKYWGKSPTEAFPPLVRTSSKASSVSVTRPGAG